MSAREMLFCSDKGFMKSTLSLIILNKDLPASAKFFFYKLIIYFTRFDKVSRHGRLLRNRTIAGRVVKESYGAAKQQHTFTVSPRFTGNEFETQKRVLFYTFGHLLGQNRRNFAP